MEIENKNIHMLCKLGLTPLEAKVFLILARSGRQKIEKIATLADIDRSNAYPTIKKLQRSALVSEIIGKPNLYEAVSLKEGISILLELKETEFSAIKKEAKEFASSIKYKNRLALMDCEFKIIKRSRKTSASDVITACKNAERSFDLIISANIFTYLFIELAAYQLDCIRRGVEYRVITEQTNVERNIKDIHRFMKYANFSLRTVSEPLGTELAISDKKIVDFNLIPNATKLDSSKLETNHPGCVEVFQNHFDKVWSQAQNWSLKRDKVNSTNRENRQNPQPIAC